MNCDVFVSYALDDYMRNEDVGGEVIEVVNEKVKQFVDAIRSFGYSVFWAQDSMLSGVSTKNQAFDHINEAFCVIVLVSQKSLASKWVEIEVIKAFEQRKLVSVLLENEVRNKLRDHLIFNAYPPIPIAGWSGNPASLDPRIRQDIELRRTEVTL
ncbi:MAG: toll/interleukin-1 receptor domain-containing protein [Planctomycetota bacterium]|nr:toll/interleukin-1 receptor domain-containing protein [Planctomycetota bacterium]